MESIERAYSNFITQRQKQNLHRHLMPYARPNARELKINGKTYINFSGNDYLGLNFHPELQARAAQWAQEYGAGSGASRLVTGNLEGFDRIENKIAALKGAEATLLMVSGFQTNASLLPALFDRKALGAEPLVFADKLNHASLNLGCAAAGISHIRFRHNDMDHLQALLEKHSDSHQPKFIVVESVYSMDGDIAPLDALYKLRDQYGCFLICDEAHATGILGPQGKGLADNADLIIGTFSKALGSFGAYIACSSMIKDYLINKCAGIIYATALPPAVLGSIDAALDLVPDMNQERAHVHAKAGKFRTEMTEAGYDCGASETQIVPLMIGNETKALELTEHLKQQGFWTTTIRPPTVPPGTSRIRFSFSAAHTQDDVNALIAALKQSALRSAA